MANLPRNIRLATCEQVVEWTLKFISTDLDAQDMTERWKLAVDAHKYLRLWDISSPEKGMYPDPPRLDLQRLQDELRGAFNEFILPLLAGENLEATRVPPSRSWPPRVFVASEGDLFCTRLLGEKVEKVGVANFLDAIHALTPLPLERFRKCEGCDRWFFPTGKRIRKKRRFCSRACNLRETARRQRERMRKKRQSPGRGTRMIRFRNEKDKEGKNGNTD